MIIDVYTDGSCENTYKAGSWASVIRLNGEMITLNGLELNTTHNRMELVALIKSIEHIKNEIDKNSVINVYSDSQYLIHLIERKEKLRAASFKTKKGKSVQNEDLVKKLYLISDTYNINYIKVKAHQKKNQLENLNRVVDIESRRVLRRYIKNIKENR